MFYNNDHDFKVNNDITKSEYKNIVSFIIYLKNYM